jgi:hypothetical protein
MIQLGQKHTMKNLVRDFRHDLRDLGGLRFLSTQISQTAKARRRDRFQRTVLQLQPRH